MLGSAREVPLELRIALLSKQGFGSYQDLMDLDLEDLEVLEHIAFTLNKSREIEQWQIQN